MPTTTTWGIDYPDENSAITPLESHFEGLAASTDEALTSLKANIRGANTTDTIADIVTDVTAINTRLALNLQEGSGAPTGAPSNSGHEGSLYWDYTNDALYIYTNDLGWKKIWEKDVISLTSGVVSAASGWDSLTGVSYTEKNGMVHLSFQVSRNGSTISAGNIANVTVANITSGYRPINSVSWSSGASGYAQGYATSAGAVIVTASGSDITDNSDLDIHITYIKE